MSTRFHALMLPRAFWLLKLAIKQSGCRKLELKASCVLLRPCRHLYAIRLHAYRSVLRVKLVYTSLMPHLCIQSDLGAIVARLRPEWGWCGDRSSVRGWRDSKSG